jgi:hypothetical protein
MDFIQAVNIPAFRIALFLYLTLGIPDAYLIEFLGQGAFRATIGLVPVLVVVGVVVAYLAVIPWP